MPLLSLSDTIALHGLSTRKALGQHFLLDENITQRVARTGGSLKGVHAVEIGPGPGGLTRALLRSDAAHVTVIEKDARCLPIMTELQNAFPGKLTVLEADALKVSLTEAVPAPRAVVANLPYNVGTLLLLNWLEDIARDVNAYAFLTLMFQKEVADRITAEPGGKEYGRLSVITQWLCDVSHGFDLAPGAFSPPPKVDSSVITLVPRKERLPATKQALERVLAAGFNQRRKMLRQSLKSVMADPSATLTSLGLDPTARAETLDVAAWCRLANAL